jgi:hypothetical protein
MKVNDPVKSSFDLKEVKEALKPFGGRCAIIVEGHLEYKIKEENEKEAYNHLKTYGFVE